jgi:hypothetical protein
VGSEDPSALGAMLNGNTVARQAVIEARLLLQAQF